MWSLAGGLGKKSEIFLRVFHSGGLPACLDVFFIWFFRFFVADVLLAATIVVLDRFRSFSVGCSLALFRSISARSEARIAFASVTVVPTRRSVLLTPSTKHLVVSSRVRSMRIARTLWIRALTPRNSAAESRAFYARSTSLPESSSKGDRSILNAAAILPFR